MSWFLRVCLFGLGFLSLSGRLLADQPKPVDLALVVFSGAIPENIEIDDVGSPLGFALGQLKDASFQDQYMASQFLTDYKSNTEPGSCIYDSTCLRKVRKDKGLRHFFVAKADFQAGGQVKVTILRITDSIVTDTEVSKVVSATASSIVNLIKAVVTESLEAEATAPKPDSQPVINVEPLPVKPVVKIPPPEPHPPLLPPNLITDSPSPRPGRNLIITGWTLVGVGAVLAGVGTYYGVQASKIETDLNENCGPNTLCPYTSTEASDLSDDMKTDGLLFNSLGIPGWVMVAGGLATAISGHVLATETHGVVEISPVLTPESAMLFSTVRF